jgi:hypothetical protein
MKILIACEFSGIVREAFRKRGHDAWSCDLLPTEIPGNHYQGDIWEFLSDTDFNWDLLIAHPPCTRLANSGVRWLKEKNLWEEMESAAYFFHSFIDLWWGSKIKMICIENPIPHKYAMNIIKRGYDQIIQPWMFGHGETKATCLWIRGLPNLEPTNIVSGREHRIHQLSALNGPGSSKNRQHERSRTFQGIADAMADQWG